MTTTSDAPVLTALPVASQRESARHAVSILKPRAGSLTLVIVLQLLAAGFAAVTPWQIGQLVDHLTTGQLTTDFGARTAIIIVVSAIISAALLAISSILAAALAEKTIADIRTDFMGHVVRVPLSVIEQVGTGAITSRASRDMETLTRGVREGLPRLLIIVVTLVTMTAASVVVGGWAGLASLAVVVPLVLVGRWYFPKSRPAFLREGRAYDNFDTVASESLNSVRTIDALDLAAARGRITGDALRRCWRMEQFVVALQSRLVAAADFSALLAIAVAVGCGGPLVAAGLASAGQVTAVAMYLLAIATPIAGMMLWLSQLQMAGTSLSRLVGIRSIAADRVSGDALPTNNVVTLTDVSFGYTTDRPVLHNVSLTIPAGQRVTIVGPSGSGKSTLGRLIGGINPPTAGAVCLGDVPIVELPADELHQRICLLTQEYHVFSTTIADNLRLATPEASDDDLWAALQTVGATDAITALPDGLGTMVGSGHLGLDPALAQQLALARIILADPDVIILDEATSLLDPRAARTMEHALNQVLAGRTVIAIAHRLHTAHDSDRILVMNDGHVIEDGTHDELLATKGDYATLWHTWQADDS